MGEWSPPSARQAGVSTTEGREVGAVVLYTVVYQIVFIMSSFLISVYFFLLMRMMSSVHAHDEFAIDPFPAHHGV
jgi:hypothetical protein